MKKNILKAIKIIAIVFCVASLIFSFVVSRDKHHLDTCTNEHCALCNIIHIAQNIISLSVAFVIYVIIGFLIYFFLARLYEEKNSLVQSSLVFQKVQLNE